MRWQGLQVENEQGRQLPGYKEPATVRHFSAPEAMDIRFYEVKAKSILNRVGKNSKVPFGWTINPYRGCTHACVYCFARPSHKYLDFDAGKDFEREIVVKVNAPELLRAQLAKPSWAGEHVALGTNTDPYQWVEGRYRLMTGIWEAMRDFENPCSLLTKSPLVLRDLPILKQLVQRTEFFANLSIPTLDEKAWRASEPHTPHPKARLEAVAELNRSGVPTGVFIAPLMPGINDSPQQVEKLLELVGEAGAVNVGSIVLHLRGELRELYFDWLRSYRPDLVETYEQLYAKGAYAEKTERKRIGYMVGKAKYRYLPQLKSASRERLIQAKGRGTGLPRVNKQIELF